MICAITYDIDTMHDKVRSQCLSAGFMECIRLSDGNVGKLPNTTLILDAMNCVSAYNEFLSQVRKVSQSIVVKKVVTFEFSEMHMYSDQLCA